MTDTICQPGTLISLTATVWRLTASNAGPMTGPGTNTYFYGSSAGVVVIDPGPIDALHTERIQASAPGPIRAIAVTHTHRDHSPGATPLAAATGAPLYGMAAPATPENDQGFVADHPLSDGAAITIDGVPPLVAIHTPGHASNHLCYLTADGWLLTGDHIMQGSTVVILPPDGEMQAYIDSLVRLKGLPLKAIAPGHGSVITESLAEIERLIEHRWARDRKVFRAVNQRPLATLDDLLPLAYDDVPTMLYPLARRSLEAHLLRLEQARRVDNSDGLWQAIEPVAADERHWRQS